MCDLLCLRYHTFAPIEPTYPTRIIPTITQLGAGDFQSFEPIVGVQHCREKKGVMRMTNVKKEEEEEPGSFRDLNTSAACGIVEHYFLVEV